MTAPTTNSYVYTGSVQTFTVPPDTYGVSVALVGGYSANVDGTYASYGGYVEATFPVKPGDILYLYVGGNTNQGAVGNRSPGGYNGGGNSYQGGHQGVGGAGATDIRYGGQTLQNRVVVAGGAGGHGGSTADFAGTFARGGTGGAGAGAVGTGGSGQTGANTAGHGGGGVGGSLTAGGAGGGSNTSSTGNTGTLGFGASSPNNGSSVVGIGGGGGGGYYGGGSGGNSTDTSGAGGGGAGSNYVAPLINGQAPTNVLNGTSSSSTPSIPVTYVPLPPQSEAMAATSGMNMYGIDQISQIVQPIAVSSKLNFAPNVNKLPGLFQMPVKAALTTVGRNVFTGNSALQASAVLGFFSIDTVSFPIPISVAGALTVAPKNTVGSSAFNLSAQAGLQIQVTLGIATMQAIAALVAAPQPIGKARANAIQSVGSLSLAPSVILGPSVVNMQALSRMVGNNVVNRINQLAVNLTAKMLFPNLVSRSQPVTINTFANMLTIGNLQRVSQLQFAVNAGLAALSQNRSNNHVALGAAAELDLEPEAILLITAQVMEGSGGLLTLLNPSSVISVENHMFAVAGLNFSDVQFVLDAPYLILTNPTLDPVPTMSFTLSSYPNPRWARTSVDIKRTMKSQ